MHAAIMLTAVLVAAPAGEPADASGALITGVVLDEAGHAVRDARVAVMRPVDGTFDVFDTPFPRSKVRSDARGRFTLRAEPGDVAVAAARYGATIALRLVPVHLPPEGARVQVRFGGPGSIRGRAIDEQGRPLAKMRITLIPERTRPDASRGDARIVRGWTDDDGSFQFGGLAPGPHRLLARGPGYACHEPCEYRDGMRVETGPALVNVPLQRTGSVSARLFRRDDAGQLQPVEDYLVRSRAFDGAWGTKEEGWFEYEVPRLWSKAPLFVEAPDLAPFATRFDLLEPVAVHLGDIVLGPGRTVRGRVRDGAGHPVEKAIVRVGFATSALEDPVAETDAAGGFDLAGVSQDAAPLVVLHRDFLPLELVAQPGSSELDVRLSPGVSLTVRAVDSDGTPLPGVQVYNVITNRSCVTGKDGFCTLSGLERKEQVLQPFLRGTARPPARQIRVPVGSTPPAPVVLRMPRRPSLLRVTVVEATGTFAQASVRIIPEEVPPERAVSLQGMIERPHYTGGIDLEKRFENLPPGRYTVVATASGGKQCTARVVDLGEGADEQLIVKLPAGVGPCRP